MKVDPDIQLWSTSKRKIIDSNAKLSFQAYLDTTRLPLCLIGGVFTVYTENSKTKGFFEVLASSTSNNQSFGICVRVESCEDGATEDRLKPDFVIFYPESNHIQAVAINFDAILDDLISGRSEPDFQAVEYIEKVKGKQEGGQPHEPHEPHLQRPRKPINIYNRPSQELSRRASRELSMPHSTHEHSSQEHLHSRQKESLKRLVLAALRLRGISRERNNEEYKQLYYHTYQAASFALRKEDNATIEAMQEMVERLLAIFGGDDSITELSTGVTM